MIKWPLMKDAITSEDKHKLIEFIQTSSRFTNGPRVREFEAEWAQWVGSQHALMVSSGSTANFLMLAALSEYHGWKPGDKIIVPACTWVTNISPVIQLGFQPLFCDINLENYSFDLAHLKLIRKHHTDVRAIFITHLLGFSAENEVYGEMFPEAVLVDDVCESHGCRSSQGHKRGAYSPAASFSFYFGHHMTTIEGGMINTNNSDLYELMRIKRSHGLARESGNLDRYSVKYPDIHPQFLFVTDGYNFRSSDLNAVLGMSQLTRLDSMIQQRRHNFTRFVEIVQANQDKFYPVFDQPGNSNFAFPFICRSKTLTIKMKQVFDQNGVEHRPIVGGNLLRQPFLKDYSMAVPLDQYNVDLLNDNGVYIGNSHFVDDKDLDWLSSVINDIDHE